MLQPIAPDRVALGANSAHGRGTLVFGIDRHGEPTYVIPCSAAELRFTPRGWTSLKLNYGDGSAAEYTAFDLKVEGRFHRNTEVADA